MTFKELIGSVCISFGPALAMFVLTIAKDPIRVIIFISAAFFWLVSLLVSSLVWYAISAPLASSTPQKNIVVVGVIFAVFFQELFRYLFYRVLRQAEAGLKKVTEGGPDIVSSSRTLLAYVSGLGFGVMSGLFAVLNVLADSAGPGTVGLHGGSQNFFLVSSLTACAFIMLHTFWSVIFFHAMDKQRWSLVVAVCLIHFTCSLLTLANMQRNYLLSLIPIYMATLMSALGAFFCAGGSFQSMISATILCFKCSSADS